MVFVRSFIYSSSASALAAAGRRARHRTHQREREEAVDLPAAPEAMPEAIWISPWETMALNCYAMRYPHLLSGYCGGKAEIKRTDDMKDSIPTCNYQGLLAHWRDHGSKEGLNRECADASVKCYAMASPDLVTAYCPGGYQFCDWTKLDLLKHYSLFGHKEGRYLACDSPSARCYVQRSPELRVDIRVLQRVDKHCQRVLDRKLRVAAPPVVRVPVRLRGSLVPLHCSHRLGDVYAEGRHRRQCVRNICRLRLRG